MINNELANDRSIVVKTDYSGVHWVTVTGTVTGQKATQFSDPRYNGIFQLSQNSNQTFHGDYAVMTISGGR